MAKVRLGSALKNLSYSLALLGALIVILSGISFWTQRDRAASASVRPESQSPQATERRIESLQGRLGLYPNDYESYTKLGAAYLQKARETGDPTLGQAEEALLRSLELKADSSKAMTLLGALELSRHRFQEALRWAEASLDVNSVNPSAYGVKGDAQSELGNYEGAFRSYQAMVDLKPNLESYARVSYARRLAGNVDGAIEAMQLAVADGPPKTESLAWARVQLGDLYFNSGRADEAAHYYQAALQDFDNYYLALARLGRVRAAQGRSGEAIELYQRAVTIIPQPALLTELGDLYTEIGEPEQAQAQYDTVEFIATLAAINRQVYNRELALYYADHDLKLEDALELASAELEFRKDIYGYDALAWTLYKNNRFDEAAEAMDQAMKLGTKDAMLFFHAGMIQYRLGNEAQAREHLSSALSLNPHFSILHSSLAQQTLSELGG